MVTIQLARISLVDPLTTGIAVVALGILLRFPLVAPVLVIAGGVVGLLVSR